VAWPTLRDNSSRHGEIIELYFGAAYWVIGRMIEGKNFSKQDEVPFYIKAISVILAIIIFAFLVWLVIEINN
jgi:hypothetical protein